MKLTTKLISTAALGVFFLGAGSALADTPATTPASNSAPAVSAAAPTTATNPAVKVKAIWDYKSELGLSDTQVSGMQETLHQFQDKMIQLKAKLQVSELNVQDLLSKQAPMTDVRTQLEKSAEIQVDMRVADIETAQKIEGSLTPDQLTKWRAIQKQARANLAARVQAARANNSSATGTTGK